MKGGAGNIRSDNDNFGRDIELSWKHPPTPELFSDIFLEVAIRDVS